MAAWLAGIPPEHAVDERIAAIERELERLKAVKLLFVHTPSRNGDEADSDIAETKKPSVGELRKRLSTERIEILNAIRSQPDSQAAIPSVVTLVRGDRDNTASNMQRMVSADLLRRIDRGLYVLTSGAEALMREIEGRDNEYSASAPG
jgi:hypothetical protein